ncbi:VWA domain-containing protein [Pricia sp. S334]|uniref:VWA domain-containing protein n=1 Tax=Pricia mediterranea TaxID=3076079 RepID=A0ABU3LA75_9FLAO|nr:VWA domain-containing protein [Pricia sp. S334]MDT7830614.1 VWA domain-containing protein [Pricia sp. S334]
MDVQTVLLIILAAIVALGLVLFQYYYKVRRKGRLYIILSFLRFLALFGALLLLINPQFTKNEYRIEKADLVVLVDRSTSVAASSDTIQKMVREITESEELGNRFTLVSYGFGAKLMDGAFDGEVVNGNGILDVDSIYSENSTDISGALRGIQDIHSASNTAVVLFTDGNQTFGRDYEYYESNRKLAVFPVVVGDTTRYDDIAVTQVNANRYAFLNNKYPLEIYVSYSGKTDIRSTLNVAVNGRTVFRENIELSETDQVRTINTLLNANSVGLKNIVVSVESLTNERNTANNSRQLAVEIIDEKTDVAIVSNLRHPDIGTLKKAIESNEQRSVTIMKPTGNSAKYEGVDLFILYQPDTSFDPLYDYIQNKNSNLFTITGTQTDWNFLNKAQNSFSRNSYNQAEEVFPMQNPGFRIFNASDFSILDFPPLNANLGEIQLDAAGDILLTQRIRGAELDQPLLAVLENNAQREAVLFGENSWKWRMQSFRNEGDFTNFDEFVGRLVRYLASNSSRERLTLEYNSMYTGSGSAKIAATYFDESYTFSPNARIDIRLKNTDTDAVTDMPMLLTGSYYQSDVSNLVPGNYDFTVSVRNENLSKSGRFSILDFDVEKQLITTDYPKLARLARNTGGKSYFPSEVETLLSELLKDDRYLPVQKGEQNTVSLIDFQILLALITIALAAEWFIRKYNGLI